MKCLLITFFITLPFCSAAQNWQSVRRNDTTYFTIPAANDYLRIIWIDSATTLGTDSIFHFYPSIRLGNTTSNCLDTLGPTWLGKNFIKKPNGDELFFNRWLDTIILKPRALINDTWVMHSDTANNEYRATITALDTMTIDNQLDSIKELTITVFNNNVATPSNVHHNKKMILSKAHGFIECLEWYGFPNVQSSSNNMYSSSTGIHSRFYSGNILVSDTTNIDFQWKYQVGNIWQFERTKARYVNPMQYEDVTRITEDSVMSVQITSPISLDVTFKTKVFTKYIKQSLADSITYTESNRTESITYSSNTKSILPEFNNALYYHNFGHSPIRYYARLNCDRPEVRTEANGCQSYSASNSCPTFNGFSVSTCIIQNIKNWSGFGQTAISYFFPGSTSGFAPPYHSELKFYNINNCEFGSRFPIWPLKVSSSTLSSNIQIYPNPTNNKIYFNTKDNSKILSAKLFSLLGKQVANCKNCNELNAAEIANGLYLLNIETGKGVIRKKIVVEY